MRRVPAAPRTETVMELIFEVAEEGGYYARVLGHAIFTQADTWDELNVVEATSMHFQDAVTQPRPTILKPG